VCGLGGRVFFGRDGDSNVGDSLLEKMAAVLAHRGPDETVILNSGAVGFAFTRLSLVDPEGGGQPIKSPDGSVILIANGEIYNHEELAKGLRSKAVMTGGSDCEVLVHLYQERGNDFLNDVRGMFSIALWDRSRNVVLLARDRFGIKPMYYNVNRDRLIFASEIKALFEDGTCPRAIAWEAVVADQAFNGATRMDDSPVDTWFQGIESVTPGTIRQFSVEDGRRKDHRYWELQVDPQPGPCTRDDLIEQYGSTLEESVADCLMADVEIGLLLSGGVDSSVIAALAGKAGSLHTFTALTGTTRINGDAEFAHRTAKMLGVPNHQVIFDKSRVPTVDEWKNLVWLMDSPLCGPEQFYKYEMHRYARGTRPDLKAMLLGAASDEFNGGYSDVLSRGRGWDAFFGSLTWLDTEKALSESPATSAWWAQDRPRLFSRNLIDHCGSTPTTDVYSRFLRWQQRDIDRYNCWHEDRTAAGNGIEARVPFLDHRLVELSCRIPRNHRASLLWDKTILREAVVRRGWLPDDIANRPKVPFYEGRGVRHTHATFVRMLAQNDAELLNLATAGTRAKEFIDADQIRDTVKSLQRDPGLGSLELVLRVVNLGLLDAMLDELPPPLVADKGNLTPAISIGETGSIQRELQGRNLEGFDVCPDCVPALTEGTMVVRADSPPGATLLISHGSVRFVVEDEAWREMLRAVDGRTPIGELVERGGVPFAQIEPSLDVALEAGVVQLLTCEGDQHAVVTPRSDKRELVG